MKGNVLAGVQILSPTERVREKFQQQGCSSRKSKDQDVLQGYEAFE